MSLFCSWLLVGFVDLVSLFGGYAGIIEYSRQVTVTATAASGNLLWSHKSRNHRHHQGPTQGPCILFCLVGLLLVFVKMHPAVEQNKPSFQALQMAAISCQATVASSTAGFKAELN